MVSLYYVGTSWFCGDMEDDRFGQFYMGMLGTLSGEPIGLGRRLIVMPRRHHESVIGNVSEAENIKIGPIDAVMPFFAIDTQATT